MKRTTDHTCVVDANTIRTCNAAAAARQIFISPHIASCSVNYFPEDHRLLILLISIYHTAECTIPPINFRATAAASATSAALVIVASPHRNVLVRHHSSSSTAAILPFLSVWRRWWIVAVVELPLLTLDITEILSCRADDVIAILQKQQR